MDFYEELEEFKKEHGFNNKELGEIVGKSGDTFRKAVNRKSLSDLEMKELKRLIQFGKNSGSVSLKEATDKLFKEMERSENIKKSNLLDDIGVSEPAEVFRTKSGNVVEELPSGKFLLSVPMVPVRAQATYLSEHTDADFISELTRVSFIVDRVVQGSYRAFEIQNDSMNDGTINAIPDGAVVLGRELGKQHWTSPLRTNQFPYWIIVHKDTVMCKEIVNHDTEKGIIKCHSLNSSPEYQDFEVSLNDVHQLFNIIKKQL